MVVRPMPGVTGGAPLRWPLPRIPVYNKHGFEFSNDWKIIFQWLENFP
jgi:hypothetical protein